MSTDFAVILDDCLARLRRGESLEKCLAAYPAHAEALRPLLTTALNVRQVPTPQARSAAVGEGRDRMLAAFAATRLVDSSQAQGVSSRRLSRYTGRVHHWVHTLVIGKETNRMKIALRVTVMVCVLLAIAGTATVSAAATSLPGDTLYGVKRAWEDVQLSLTIDMQTREALESQLMETRKNEVDALVQLRRHATFELHGVLQAIDGDQWTVSGLTFTVTADTLIVGEPQIGSMVRVRGEVEADGTLIALRIQALPTVTPPPFPTIVPTVIASPWPTRPVTATLQPYPTWPPHPTHSPTLTVTIRPTWPPTMTVPIRPTWPPTMTVPPRPTWPPTMTVPPHPTWPPNMTLPPHPTWPPNMTLPPHPTWPPQPTQMPGSTPGPFPTMPPMPTVEPFPTLPPRPNRTPVP